MRRILLLAATVAMGSLAGDTQRDWVVHGHASIALQSQSPAPFDVLVPSHTGDTSTDVIRRLDHDTAIAQPFRSPAPAGARWARQGADDLKVSFAYPVAYAVPGFAGAIAAGDVTGDRVPDIAVAVASGVDGSWGTGHFGQCHVLVFSRKGDGTLVVAEDVLLDAECRPDLGGIALGDMDGDSVADVTVSTIDGIAIVALNRASAARVGYSRVGREIYQLGAMDVNLDGHLDIVGLGFGDIMGEGNDPEAATIFFGDRNGGIQYAQAIYAPQTGYNDMEIGDVNSDGFPDLVIASYKFWVMAHDGAGGFLPWKTYPPPDGSWGSDAVALADINSDGRKDVVVNSNGNASNAAVWLYAQRPDGTLATPVRLESHELPGSMVGGDLNGDKLDDIAVLHEGWDAMGSYVQRPSGGFEPERLDDTAVHDHANRQGIAIVDATGDGCPDILTGDYENGLVVLAGESCTIPPPPRTGGRLPPTRK